MRLAHKTALITGATTGIGFQTAQLFIKEGARVFITGQDAARLASAAAQLGHQATALYVNVLDLASLDAAATQILTQTNGIDILFANAGVAFATPVDTTPEARFDELMDTNVKGVFFTVQKFAPLMGQGGSIILNTSWLNQVGTAGLSALSASKAAVRSFTRSFAAELLPRGIRVNAVSPGAINTPIHSKTGMTPEQLAQFAAGVQAKIPLARFGEAHEVAQAALFLASDASSYMLGAEMVVDGGTRSCEPQALL
jgi:NAD(P)-dependent dehydrogenase (short-subunit alcohol dehydrogenase family)